MTQNTRPEPNLVRAEKNETVVEVKRINSLQELIEALEADNANYDGQTWYRGQSDTKWPLLPGYFRLEQAPSEATLLKQFKQSAMMLISSKPADSFDWLFLMQHYGVPTRLLDWSESPLAALYFATNEKENPSDAALWSLRPSELNKAAGIHNVHETGFIPSFEDEELTNYSVEALSQNDRTQLKPLATIATRNNARIQAQQGVFTIHHHARTSVEDVDAHEHIIKYEIPADSKVYISGQLALLGFTKFQLFPELASIGENIKGVLK